MKNIITHTRWEILPAPFAKEGACRPVGRVPFCEGACQSDTPPFRKGPGISSCLIISILYVLSALFSASLPAQAADKLTISRFLATAREDHQLQNHAELVGYVDGAAYESTSYFDKIEFRTETGEFDIAKQKYALRFYPKTRDEIRCGSKVAETSRKAVRAEHRVLFNRALQNRYGLVLDFLETRTLISTKKELLTVCDDRITVLRKMSVSGLSSDVGTLVSAEEQYVALRMELVELDNKINGITEEIRTIAGYPAEIGFDEKDLIGPERIGEMIPDLRAVPNPDNISLRDQRLKTELAETEYMLERSKNKRFLNFFKLGYDAGDSDEPKRAFSVEVGFSLPFGDSGTKDTTRRKKSYLKEKLKYENEKRRVSEKVRELSTSLERLIPQYRILVSQKSDSNAEISFRKYMKMEGINPLILLKIRESILKSGVRLIQIGYLIRRQYIELMNMTDRLSEDPLKNHISANTEDIP
ncbi:TolC family protein [Desulfobacterales bacterium HSG2]|nr:TolC family protein [Desulfobacterales bacterium HSG2]